MKVRRVVAGGTRTAAASRRLIMRSARMQIFCHCSMSVLIFPRTTLLRCHLNYSVIWESTKGAPQLILEVTRYAHLLDAINALTC